MKLNLKWTLCSMLVATLVAIVGSAWSDPLPKKKGQGTVFVHHKSKAPKPASTEVVQSLLFVPRLECAVDVSTETPSPLLSSRSWPATAVAVVVSMPPVAPVGTPSVVVVTLPQPPPKPIEEVVASLRPVVAVPVPTTEEPFVVTVTAQRVSTLTFPDMASAFAAIRAQLPENSPLDVLGIFSKVKMFVSGIGDRSHSPVSVKRYPRVGEKDLVMIQFKCPIEVVTGFPSPMPIMVGIHWVVDQAIVIIDTAEVLPFNVQTGCT